MNITIDKYGVLCNQPSVTQIQSIFIWPIRAIRRHFDARSMSSTPHSSPTSPNPKLLLATTIAFRLSGLQPQRQDLVLICCFFSSSKCLFNPGVLLSMETLHPPVNQVFPFLGMRSWSCVAAYPTWASSSCMCLLCDRRHLKHLPNMNNRPLPLQGEVCQQLYKNWAQTLIWKTDE